MLQRVPGGGHDRVFVLASGRWAEISDKRGFEKLGQILVGDVVAGPNPTTPLRSEIWVAFPAIFSARDMPTVQHHAVTRILKTASAQKKTIRAPNSRSHFQPFIANVYGRGELSGGALIYDFSMSHDVEPVGDPQNDCQLLLD
jgi:hypothetical protein